MLPRQPFVAILRSVSKACALCNGRQGLKISHYLVKTLPDGHLEHGTKTNYAARNSATQQIKCHYGDSTGHSYVA